MIARTFAPGFARVPKLSPACALSSSVSFSRIPGRALILPVCCSSSYRSPEPSVAPPGAPDRFTSAALRLKNLLAASGDGDAELVDKVVKELAVGERIQIQIGAAAAITVTAVIISQLSGVDPWGGILKPQETLNAAAFGALGAIPLVVLRLWCWSPDAKGKMPEIEDMHQAQLEIVRPWFSNVSQPQLMLMMAFDILPLILLVYPAAQGSICAFVGMLDMVMSLPPGEMPQPDWAMDETQAASMAAAVKEPDAFLKLGALSLTALVMSSSRSSQLAISEEEEELLATAVENADRYYRVSSANTEEARSGASAFKAVARAYLETKSETAMLGSAIMALDVYALGALWYLSGNLAAPAVAAMASYWVDYYSLRKVIREGEEKLAKAGKRPNDS